MEEFDHVVADSDHPVLDLRHNRTWFQQKVFITNLQEPDKEMMTRTCADSENKIFDILGVSSSKKAHWGLLVHHLCLVVCLIYFVLNLTHMSFPLSFKRQQGN